MLAFITANGGFIAMAIVVLGLYNILMTAIGQAFVTLHKQEPGFLQKAGAVGLTLQQWLSASKPTPTPQIASASTAVSSGS